MDFKQERPTPMAEREIDIFFAGSLEDAIARPVHEATRLEAVRGRDHDALGPANRWTAVDIRPAATR